MNTLVFTDRFRAWLRGLRDAKAKARILERIGFAEVGNFGDVKPVGDGVCEMRIHYGPGYRVYFVQRGRQVFVLLVGGDKSTQATDIQRARRYAKELDNGSF